ncbi:hypothetical protein L332_03480 [Agrococcus pavilionensis RW1]|uniref:DNA 5'-3' helicase n=1 Tax=Agrococcus pavilionensis RW1 TaxID=1330458 RepID=U1MNP2_9MICO|nr:replicative DNA helicase [Agrococcus pavilionensis]ERG63516.1 hypothetical protein L332_03480 [Agrococcus pavilionensis RW1]
MSEYDEIPVERTPPADDVAERSVIGAILLSRQAMEDVAAAMQPGDFYQPRHELILRAALALTHRGVPVDAVTVGDELQRVGKLAAAGGVVYLHECTSAVTTVANAGHYARIVAEKAIMRRLVEAGMRITQMGYASEGDPAALVEGARAEVDAVSTATVTETGTIGAGLDDLARELEEAPTLVPTPWPSLDGVLGGFRPGAMYVIAGRPGKGKSVVALQIARKLAMRGPVGFVSLEMSKSEVLQRMVAQVASIPLTSLTTHQLTDVDWNSMRIARPSIMSLPLHVRDDLRTLEQVSSWARTLHRQGSMQALVVDYLGLLTSEERHRERHLEIGAMTGALKRLAMALDIPVFLLSQLNRQAIARGKGKEVPPVLTDLRESGSIEQDADVVMLLHREDRKNVLEVNVAKHRQGPTDRIELMWEGPFVRAVTKQWGATAFLEEPKEMG